MSLAGVRCGFVDTQVQCGDRLACVSAGPMEIALTSPETLIAPADWPNSVTLSGSPPKAAMFSCTQCRAATWSSSPQFPRAWLSPVLGTGDSWSVFQTWMVRIQRAAKAPYLRLP